MRKTVFGACVLSLFIGTTAWAGFRLNSEVYIDTVNMSMSGSFGSARNSADSTQYLGCMIDSYSTGYTYLSCWARNSAGTYANCTSTSATLIANAQSISSDGYVYIKWDSSGTCTFLRQYHDSRYAPKNP